MNFLRISALSVVWTLAAFLCGCGPDNGLKDLEKGRQAYRIGDLKKAQRHFLESQRLGPENVDAMVELAKVGMDLGELAEAAKWISKAEKTAADDLDVKLLGAQIAWHAKEYDKESACILYHRLHRESTNFQTPYSCHPN